MPLRLFISGTIMNPIILSIPEINMKTALAIFALTLSFSTFASENITLTMKMHETLNMKKVSKTRFEKISDAVTGVMKVDYISGTQIKNLATRDINESDNTSALSYEVTGKNILKVEDTKENINSEIKADIDKTLFGNIKGIKIEAATMEQLYAASMKKSGLDILKNYRIPGLGFGSSIVMNDMNCKADEDLLVCQQDVTLTMQIGN
jgi:hypothetical protein